MKELRCFEKLRFNFNVHIRILISQLKETLKFEVLYSGKNILFLIKLTSRSNSVTVSGPVVSTCKD